MRSQGPAPATDEAAKPNEATDGGVFTFGTVPFLGSTGGIRLDRPVVGFAARPPLSFKVDPFANDDASINRSSNWVIEGGDERLVLTHEATGTAGGARILGVESLNVSLPGSPSFHVEAGTTCSGQLPALQIYADTNGDGAYDQTNVIQCSAGGSTANANPVTGGPTRCQGTPWSPAWTWSTSATAR